MVDLVEGTCREGNLQATEFVCDHAIAIQHNGFILQHHTRVPGIDVLDHRPDLRELLYQGIDEIPAPRELFRARDKHHHHLTGFLRPPQQHMAQNTGPGVFVVELVLHAGDRLRDEVDDFIQQLRMHRTAAGVDHPVALWRIQPAVDLLVFVLRKSDNHLVPVPDGTLRHDHRLDLHRKICVFHDIRDLFLLQFRLFDTRHRQQRTAAA